MIHKQRVDALLARMEQRQFGFRPVPSFAVLNDDGSYTLHASAYNSSRQAIESETRHNTLDEAKAEWARFVAAHGGSDAPLLIWDV